MIEEKTIYTTEDGEKFDTLSMAEKWQACINAKGNTEKENELRKQIYKNLFEFLKASVEEPEPLLEYLIVNKKEIIMLLTNGNLDTVYRSPRTFVKPV